MATKNDPPTCICGGKLKERTGSGVSCDGCYKSCSVNETVFGCEENRYCEAHPNGYDLCAQCAANNSKPPSNVSYLALREQGFEFQETWDALTQANGDLSKALKILSKSKSTTNKQYELEKSKLNENESLKQIINKQKNQINQLQTKYAQLQQKYDDESSKYKKKNIHLTNEINKLLDDKKEMELIIINLKQENKSLKHKNIDEQNFMNWDHEQILLWILSIDNGHFEKYSDILGKELTESEMKGNDLLDLNTKDIRGLGVKVFSDAKKLEKYIQKLINKYGNKQQDNGMENEGDLPPTAYL